MFGVPKGQSITLDDGQIAESLRLIINLIPANEVLELLCGDIRTMPFSGQWTNVSMDGDMVLWSAEDLKCGFYLFGLPAAWAKWFGLEEPVPGWLLGRPEIPWVYVGMVVVPMGWASGTGLVQYLFRRLAIQMSKLPPQLELRKDQPTPCDASFKTQDFWQIYIDNFDEARSCRSSQESTSLIGQPSEWSLRLRETGEKLGIVFQDDPEKLKRQEIRTKTLGAESTSSSRVRPSMQRMVDFAGMVMATLSEQTPSLKHLEITTGVGISFVPFRRQLMAAYGHMWRIFADEPTARGQRSQLAAHDLLQALSTLPLCVIQLDRQADSTATASDSSEWGGAVTASTQLTEQGKRRLSIAEKRRAVGPADNLVVFDWFAGIGGLRRSLEILGVQPGSYFVSETDEHALRTLRHNYPDLHELGDITKITEEDLLQAAAQKPSAQHVLSFGGSPCQDVSGANAMRQGLSGSRSSLWTTMEQLEVEVLPRVFPEAARARGMENVASMKKSDAATISSIRGQIPYKLCASEFVPSRRPRLYWLSWKVPASHDLSITSSDDWQRVEWHGHRPSAYPYLPQKARVAQGFVAFPTFMRPVARARPPICPAGIQGCDEQALERWRADEHRYPPYQYKVENMMTRDKGRS